MSTTPSSSTAVPVALRERLDGVWEAVSSDLDDVLEEAYAAGYSAGMAEGAERMRERILQAAQVPTAQSVITPPAPVSAYIPRAPRGSVRKAITAALRQRPGLTELEVGQAAERLDRSVSSRSVGGELRRKRGVLYQIDAGRWFLIAQTGEKETAEPESSAVPKTETAQEATDAPATSIAA